MTWARRGALGAALITAGVVIYQSLDPTACLAAVMLDSVIMPAGSVAVTGLPGQVFAQPSEGVACSQLTDAARFWIAPGDPAAVAAFLAAHPPSWLPKHGTGSLTGGDGVISYSVADAPPGRGFGDPLGLDFTVAALAAGMTGIRADAEVVPPNATCSVSGGAGVPVAGVALAWPALPEVAVQGGFHAQGAGPLTLSPGDTQNNPGAVEVIKLFR